MSGPDELDGTRPDQAGKGNDDFDRRFNADESTGLRRSRTIALQKAKGAICRGLNLGWRLAGIGVKHNASSTRDATDLDPHASGNRCQSVRDGWRDQAKEHRT